MEIDAKAKEWLTEHIMHRIRASLDDTYLINQILAPPHSAEYDHALSIHFIALHARHEGRIAALRWLIEFVGINATDDLKPRRPPTTRETSEFLSKFGEHPLIPIPSESADYLAKVWKACSQATAHPTSGTNHEPLTPETRQRALSIVLDHLQNTIYSAAGDSWKNYIKVVAIQPVAPGRAHVQYLREH